MIKLCGAGLGQLKQPLFFHEIVEFDCSTGCHLGLLTQAKLGEYKKYS